MIILRRIGNIAALGLAACTSAPVVVASAAPTSATAATRSRHNDVRWFRTAAEYRASAEQTYTLATERLDELARGLAAQSWGVILDGDETVLDNAEYEWQRAVLDSVYTPVSWNAWVRQRAATAIPGSVAFTRHVHTLGGRVVIVTNRTSDQCDATRANLQSIGIAVDAVLCEPPGESDKNPRFQRVENGTAVPGLPALRVLEWLGDNILDFPGLSQASRTDPRALSEFGKRFFILPNPMYGSWE